MLSQYIFILTSSDSSSISLWDNPWYPGERQNIGGKVGVVVVHPTIWEIYGDKKAYIHVL
jgi:hypothetical protein